jgi:hypothetical protein
VSPGHVANDKRIAVNTINMWIVHRSILFHLWHIILSLDDILTCTLQYIQ